MKAILSLIGLKSWGGTKFLPLFKHVMVLQAWTSKVCTNMYDLDIERPRKGVSQTSNQFSVGLWQEYAMQKSYCQYQRGLKGRILLIKKTDIWTEPDTWKDITAASFGPSTYPFCAHRILPHGWLTLTWCSPFQFQARSPLKKFLLP